MELAGFAAPRSATAGALCPDRRIAVEVAGGGVPEALLVAELVTIEHRSPADCQAGAAAPRDTPLARSLR